MNSYETNENTPSPTEQMLSLLQTMKKGGDFHLEDGETKEDVVARCELLEIVLGKLEQIAPIIIKQYRDILEENALDSEQTGKLSLVVVGGRVHGESQLKTWSDIDTIITAEKPFLPTRRVFLTPEEEASLPEPVVKSGGIKREMMTKFLSEVLPRLSELTGRDLSNEGVIEVKGYGDQRNEDVKDGLVIFTEQ